MKRKIEDYKKQKIAIYCSSKEEWDKIDNLFSDFLEEEFEIGKWYKCNYNRLYYIKIKKKIPRKNYNEIHGNVIYMNTFREDDYLANTLMEQNLFLLKDLSEIQQFLPENHEDKFKISIKETFKKGDIVVAKPNNGLKDSSGSSPIYHHFTTEYQYEIKNTKEDLIQFVGDKTIWFHAKDFQLFSEKESIYKIGDWIIAENAEQPKAFQISEITDEYYKCHDNDPDVLGFSIKNSKKLGLRKALPHEIPHQYPLTPKECFKPNIYDFGDIYITPIIKKTNKITNNNY
jgi:hypothetical protein